MPIFTLGRKNTWLAKTMEEKKIAENCLSPKPL